MQIIRTIVWIVITAALVAFVAMNWDPAPVNFWPLENGLYLHLQWPVGFIAILFFAAGVAPMWLLAKAGRWRMTRRMTALENSVRAGTSTTGAADAAPVVSGPELSHGVHRNSTPTGNYPGDLRED